MSKGPRINYTKGNFTTRDNLGINSAGTSFQAVLSPVINTVTPRAFYWIFAVWNYYDYHQNYKTEKKTTEDFENNFLKKNDYYFVLANLLTEGSDRDNLVGKDNCAVDLKENDGPFAYNRGYFKAHFGGMQYYVPGCQTLGLITYVDNDGNEFKFPKVTEKLGVPMAQAFEEIIKDTEYYKTYRLTQTPVPKEVLIELGKTISLSMDGMEECKKWLRKAFFESSVYFDNSTLIHSKDYLLFIDKTIGTRGMDSSKMRNVLYDTFYPGGPRENELPDELKDVARDWEVVIGRQYFTIAIEVIWRFMLIELTSPMVKEDWFRACIKDTLWSIDPDSLVVDLMKDAYYEFDEREKMALRGARGSKDVSMSLELAIKIMLSVCNRFKGREDIEQDLLYIGGQISVGMLLERTKEHPMETISELAVFIMNEWVLKRHEQVAFRKLMDGRDGYYIEKIDNKYFQRYIAYPDFTGNRMMQLKHVMEDLDMMENV